MLSGFFAEAFMMRYAKNTWVYHKPDAFGAPLWLLPLWGIVCITSLEIYTLTNYFQYLLQ